MSITNRLLLDEILQRNREILSLIEQNQQQLNLLQFGENESINFIQSMKNNHLLLHKIMLQEFIRMNNPDASLPSLNHVEEEPRQSFFFPFPSMQEILSPNRELLYEEYAIRDQNLPPSFTPIDPFFGTEPQLSEADENENVNDDEFADLPALISPEEAFGAGAGGSLPLTNLLGAQNVLSEQEIDLVTKQNVLFGDLQNPLNDQCPITLQHFSWNDSVTVVLGCQHVFAPDAILEHFREHSILCPMCRFNLKKFCRRQFQEEFNFFQLESI
jgi:hypothetical protein